MDFNKNRLLEDRYGALVIYKDGARCPHAIAQREAKKILHTDEPVPIEDMVDYTLPNGEKAVLAIFQWRKKK
ncbi:MAG: hypothetical protein PVH61_31705 [Candidatus Aminicenantes bacterium]